MRFAWLLALAACTPSTPPAAPPISPPPAPAPTEEVATATTTPPPDQPNPIDESREPKGHLATSTIQKVVRANMSKMTACYEAALAKNPNEPAGQVRVRLVIARDGRVASAASSNEKAAPTTLGGALEKQEAPLSDQAVVACVLGEFKKLTFPPPDGGIVVLTYPLSFSAQ